MKLRILLLALSCVAVGPAYAGLFSDDEARQQIQDVAKRVSGLEAEAKNQATVNGQQDDTNKQQTRTMLDLQSQIDALNAQIRGLIGQNENLDHGIQDAEKRQKDFYIDLDTRLRNLEKAAADAKVKQAAEAVAASSVAAEPQDDMAAGNRAFENAHGLYKAGKHQEAVAAFEDFVKKFIDSVYVPNAYYEMGSAYFVLGDYKKAQENYQTVLSQYGFSPKAPDAMLGIADCYQERKEVITAKRVLKQIVTKYPGTEAAKAAEKRLSSSK
jgi:tol-pal system protein YbgF